MKQVLRLALLAAIGLTAACAGPSWRETNLQTPAKGPVPRDNMGNPAPSGAAR